MGDTDTIEAMTLQDLARETGWPKVTIMLPARRETIAGGEDQIRLRNLAGRAIEDLVDGGYRRPDAQALLAPILDMGQSGGGLWTGGFEGLAIFVGPRYLRVLRLATPLSEACVVGDRFYLRPLYVAAKAVHPFWALALDKENARLFHGSERGVEQVPLPPGTPTSLADEIASDEFGGRDLGYRSIPTHPPQPGRGPTMFHGHGNAKDAGGVQLGRFFSHLDKGVVEAIGKRENEPLVLLGLDREVAAYRAVNTYAHLVPEQAPGDTHRLSDAEIGERAVQALRPLLAREEDADLAELREKTGTPLASTDAAEIVAAAAGGRVKTLFVDDSAGPWGSFDQATFTATRSRVSGPPRYLRERGDLADVEDPSEYGWDLVDLAAARTLLTNGKILAFSGPDTPVRSVAAVYRY